MGKLITAVDLGERAEMEDNWVLCKRKAGTGVRILWNQYCIPQNLNQLKNLNQGSH